MNKLISNYFYIGLADENPLFKWYNPEYMGTVADWVSGILTLIAICITLYFSTRDNFKRMKVFVTWEIFNFLEEDTIKNKIANIEAVNLSEINIHIVKAGFCNFKKRNGNVDKTIRFFKPNYYQEIKRREFSEFSDDNMPSNLNNQDYVKYETRYKYSYIRSNLLFAKFMRAFVQDSTGKRYYSKRIKLKK